MTINGINPDSNISKLSSIGETYGKKEEVVKYEDLQMFELAPEDATTLQKELANESVKSDKVAEGLKNTGRSLIKGLSKTVNIGFGAGLGFALGALTFGPISAAVFGVVGGLVADKALEVIQGTPEKN